MGAAELQKGAAHAAAELEKISTRRFQVDDLRQIQEELGNTRAALDRACEEMEQADTLLREGGFARRHEADSLLSDGVKRAEEELTKLEATLKRAREVKPGAAGVPAREIELAASAAIAALFDSDSEDAKARSPPTPAARIPTTQAAAAPRILTPLTNCWWKTSSPENFRRPRRLRGWSRRRRIAR